MHVYCQNAANIYALSKKPFIILGMQFNIVMEQKYTTEKYKYL